MEETNRLRSSVSNRSWCLFIHIYVLLFVIGVLAIVLKETAFQNFITLILKVNMSDSKNNQALQLAPLEPTPAGKNPAKFNMKALLSSSVSCHCQLYWLYVYCQLQYGAELCWPPWQFRISIHLSDLTQPESFKRLLLRTHTQDTQQYFERYQCLFTYTEYMNECLCPW